MKKTFKRIIALAIVLCTLGAMMIPGVSISAHTKDFNISFMKDLKAAGMGKNVVLDQTYFDKFAANYATSGWQFYDLALNTVKSVYTYGNEYYLGVTIDKATDQGWHYVPLKIHVPQSGNYTVAYQHQFKDYRAFGIKAFIMDIPEGGYADAAAFEAAADEVTGARNAAASEELFIPYSGTNGVAGTATYGWYSGAKERYLEAGKDYILVLAYTANSGTSDSNFGVPNIKLVYEDYPEWTSANSNLTVNFKKDFDNAGIGADKYISDSALLNAYKNGTNSWASYIDPATGVMAKSNNTYNVRAASTDKYFQLRTNSDTAEGCAPLIFTAPGTGEYKLSLNFGVSASTAVRADYAGAFIIEAPKFDYTRYSLPNSSNANAKAKVLIDVDAKDEDGEYKYWNETFTSEDTVSLQGGKEYLIIFFSYLANGKTTPGYADFTGFSLNEVAAYVNDASYVTLDSAVAAAQENADTVKLNKNVAVTELDLGTATLDLNGKTLTAEAVVGTVVDSVDGAGLIKTDIESVINAAEGQIALWDNNQNGYRAFNYTFVNVDPEIQGIDNYLPAVNKNIDTYAAATTLKSLKGNSTTDFRTFGHDMNALYTNGDLDYRLELSTSYYQAGRTGLGWRAKSICQYGSGYFALRFRSPGAGEMDVTISTTKPSSTSQAHEFKAYIVKASDIEANYNGEYADYAAAYNAYLDSVSTNPSVTQAAVLKSIEGMEPLYTGVSETKTHTWKYTFESGCDYVMIFDARVYSGGYLCIQDMDFTREANSVFAARSFWSYLEFSNHLAYLLAPNSGLEVGFNVKWNGKTVMNNARLPDATLSAWAQAELEDTEIKYGFYIRTIGWENMTEEGVLEVAPYIKSGTFVDNNDAYVYTHVVTAE